MRNLICSVLLAVSAMATSAQNGRLFVGLTTTYFPSGVAGVGVAADYRWRLAPHLEAIGQFSANHFWQTRPSLHDGPRVGLNDKYSYLFFGGLGLGYRGAPNGFHIGLLAGGTRYGETVANGEVSMMVRPAAALTMGHGIGERLDVSIDTWVLRTAKGEFFALPMLKLAYALSGKRH